jgi:hypothetical protein
MSNPIGHLAVALPFVLLAAACGSPQGPHVRFARASSSEIEAARNSGQVVWYDFEAGDEVPLEFGLLGVSEAITDQPTRMIAQRPFSIVVFPDGRTMFSFDGSSLTSPRVAARWSIALGSDDRGGRAGLLLFIGQPQDVPQELR